MCGQLLQLLYSVSYQSASELQDCEKLQVSVLLSAVSVLLSVVLVLL